MKDCCPMPTAAGEASRSTCWMSRCCGCFKRCCTCPKLEGLTLLAIRLLLFFPLFEAGMNKYNNFADTVAWFDQGLGLPFPAVMVGLTIAAEVGGAVFLLLGLLTRLATLPLMVVMLVAAFWVHFSNGWLAVAAQNSMWFGQMPGATKLVELQQAIVAAGSTNPALLAAYEATLAHGPLAVLNGGMQFAIIYLLFLLVLMARGAGWLSLDTIIARCCNKNSCPNGCCCTTTCAMPQAKAVAVSIPVAKAVAKKPQAKKAVKAVKKTAKKRR